MNNDFSFDYYRMTGEKYKKRNKKQDKSMFFSSYKICKIMEKCKWKNDIIQKIAVAQVCKKVRFGNIGKCKNR